MYSASKYAVVAISEALQQELSATGAKIGVSVVCPAMVNTRIAESERNRPVELANDKGPNAPQQAQVFGEAFRAALAMGSSPHDIADRVLEAVLENRLYVADRREIDERVQARFVRILDDVVVTTH
jgi:short-subunit dehydrogenase